MTGKRSSSAESTQSGNGSSVKRLCASIFFGNSVVPPLLGSNATLDGSPSQKVRVVTERYLLWLVVGLVISAPFSTATEGLPLIAAMTFAAWLSSGSSQAVIAELLKTQNRKRHPRLLVILRPFLDVTDVLSVLLLPVSNIRSQDE